MSSTFDRLNLRPFERRLVVGVGAVVFIVLNIVFVWPHFDDYEKAKEALKTARKKQTTFQEEIRQKPETESRVKAMEAEAEPVPEEDQKTEFLRLVQMQAAQSGVNISGTSRQTTRTNDPFFLEQQQTITVICEEQPLVDFLFKLGTSASMVRVRDLSLRPDPPRQRLNGNIKLVASFQRRPPARTIPRAAAQTAKTEAKPAEKSAQATQPAPGKAAKPVPATNPPPTTGGRPPAPAGKSPPAGPPPGTPAAKSTDKRS